MLIHGAAGNHLYWPPGLRRLPGYPVYALDLPGHGKSTAGGLASIEEYSLSLIDWFASLGIQQAFIAGHSMGSAIALNVALAYPSGVCGLGILGGGARFKINPALLASASDPCRFRDTVETIIKWSFSRRTAPRLSELAAMRMAETKPEVLLADLTACAAFDASDLLDQVNIPVLLICGEEDKMMSPQETFFLASRLRQARLEVVSHAGHMVMLEQPQIVTEIISNFLMETVG